MLSAVRDILKMVRKNFWKEVILRSDINNEELCKRRTAPVVKGIKGTKAVAFLKWERKTRGWAP